ncbi:MAG TPA: TonB-dependent receptor [Rhodocyclaceae bacterium]
MHARFIRTALAAAVAAAFNANAAVPNDEAAVVVTATRQPQRASESLSDITVIGSEEIQDAGPAATVTELLARQPGIEINRNGGPGTTSNVFIRGTNANHVLLLVDGIRVGSTTIGAPAWEYIPLQQVERIEIIRGPASSLYGSDAIGGVVQIFTKRGEGSFQPFAEAGYGTWNTSALSAGFSGAQDRWHYSFQVSDKRSDSFPAVNNPASAAYNPANRGYRNASSSGSLSFAPAKGHELGASYLYSDGWNRYNATFPGPASDAYKQSETLSAVTLHSRDQLTDAWTSTLRVGQSADDGHNYDNGRAYAAIRSTQTQYQWQNDVRLPLGTALLAVERNEQNVSSSTTRYLVTSRSIDSYLAGWTAGLGRQQWQLNLRRDNNSQFGDKTTGLIGYGYRFSPAWRAHVSAGSAFKAPTFNDLYWPGAGNPALRPETAQNREASLHYAARGEEASVTYYHNAVSNLIQWAPVDPANLWGAWLPFNVARATLRGVTVAYSGTLGAYRLSSSIDIQDPRDDMLQKTLQYRARQTGKLALTRDFGACDVGTELQASGKRYNDAANTQALGGYTLVNAFVNYRVRDDVTLFARANNVFDKRYALVRDFATPGANLFVGLRYAPK